MDSNSLPAAAVPHLVVDDLLTEARRESGLTEFGDPWFVQPLTQLIHFINTEASPVSADGLGVQTIKGYLIDRLRLMDFVKRNPEVRDESLDIAGIIIGMPRGGSTLLQRLLCSSPQLTAPRFWELMSPLPLPGETPGDPTPRIARAQAVVDAMNKTWPGSTTIHPTYPDIYDEESFLISRSFLSVDYTFHFHLPSYVRWHWQQDLSKSYAELKLWLQALQYQAPFRRHLKWILKSGHHMWCGGLRYVLKSFPNAKALMTHRSLDRVIPSVCSLRSVFMVGHTRDFDPKVLGPEAMELYRDGLIGLDEVRKEQPADRFIDIQYTDLVKDPAEQFRQTMHRMGLIVGPEDEQAVSQWVENNRRDAQSQHSYALEDFGLNRAEILEQFAFYSRQYLINSADR